jgi:hypothetical protein
LIAIVAIESWWQLLVIVHQIIKRRFLSLLFCGIICPEETVEQFLWRRSEDSNNATMQQEQRRQSNVPWSTSTIIQTVEIRAAGDMR